MNRTLEAELNVFLIKHITVWKCIISYVLFYLPQVTLSFFIFATTAKIKNHPDFSLSLFLILPLSLRMQVKQYEFRKLL